MDRCAVLVDAGYLYAEGGKLCCGTRGRGRSALQPFLAVKLLEKVALETTGLPVLRTYWYDGAHHGIRTQEQREVAGLPNVKLRLGRLNANNEQRPALLSRLDALNALKAGHRTSRWPEPRHPGPPPPSRESGCMRQPRQKSRT